MSLNKRDLEFGQVVYRNNTRGIFIGITDELYPEMREKRRNDSVEVIFEGTKSSVALTVAIYELSLNKPVRKFKFKDRDDDEYKVEIAPNNDNLVNFVETTAGFGISFYKKDIDNIIKLFTDFKEFYSNK